MESADTSTLYKQKYKAAAAAADDDDDDDDDDDSGGDTYRIDVIAVSGSEANKSRIKYHGTVNCCNS